jgi:hypothetical protein
MFDEMYAKGKMPWAVWESAAKIHQNQRLLMQNKQIRPVQNLFTPLIN